MSPDGTWIVSGSEDMTIRMWDSATGLEKSAIAGSASACAVGPDGTWIALVDDSSLTIWDVETGAARATSSCSYRDTNDCAVSPDGTWVLTTSRNGMLRAWDAATGAELAAIGSDIDGDMYACAVSPDGAWVISAGLLGDVWIRDAAAAQQAAHYARVNACVFGPDGSWVVSAADDGKLMIWDAATGAVQRTLDGNPPDNRWRGTKLTACAVSPSGSWIVSADDICYFNIWDVATGAIRTTFATASGHINACAFSPDGAWIVSAGDRGGLQMRDAVTGRERAVLGDDATPMLGCAVSPDGTWIVGVDKDREIIVWDAITQRERAASPGRRKSNRSGAAGSTGALADAVDHQARAGFLDETESVGDCAVSPDGEWIVSTCADNTLSVWDAATCARLATLRSHAGSVNACAVSADGRYIASGGDDRTLRIWDATTGIELAMLGLPFTVTAVVFHPFEPRVACGDAAGRVHLEDIVGLEIGPLAVTAALTVRCPVCQRVFAIARDHFGIQATCPQPGCARRLRVNPLEIWVDPQLAAATTSNLES